MQCNNCGRPYDDSFPDWSICSGCLRQQVPDNNYIDSLGIVWSPEELEDAGGQTEVEKLCAEADIRRN